MVNVSTRDYIDNNITKQHTFTLSDHPV